jgi:DNA polymerase III subunit beta
MDLQFDREGINEALHRIVGAAEKRVTMPILGNVRIRPADQDGGIRLDTTDLELAWVATTGGTIDPEIDVTVSARKLLEVVKAAPPEAAIRGRVGGDRLTVGFGSSRFSLATLPGADFPEWQGVLPQEWLEVPQRLFRQLIESTLFSVAQQDVRYYVQGLLLVARGTLLRAVATDGHRLALNEAELEQGLAESHECIIPRKAIMELRRNLQDDESVLRIGFGGGQAMFDFGSARLVTKLIEGKFPDYERVIPTGLPGQLTVDREVFRQALGRVGIVASDKYRGVRLLADAGGCRLVAHNAEREEAEEALPAVYEGEDIEIGFNLAYLMDVLNALGSDQLRLELRDGNSSTLIRAVPEDRARYVVMPIRL